MANKRDVVKNGLAITTANPDGFDGVWLAAISVNGLTFYSDKSYSTWDSARRKSRKIVALLTNKR